MYRILYNTLSGMTTEQKIELLVSLFESPKTIFLILGNSL